MKHSFLFLFFCLFLQIGWSQENTLIQPTEKGKFYIYWGYNRGWFSKSTLHFRGEHYEFSLKDVVAKDRQTPFTFSNYFNPAFFTQPQYNVRLGYFLNHRYSISIGTDHMKYVMTNHQSVLINGFVENSETIYDGSYQDEQISLHHDFLQFEHTDGLNYGNIDGRIHHRLFAVKNFELQFMEGIG